MFKYVAPVTPAEVSPALQSLMDELVPSGQPFYVDVSPLQEAPQDECFFLVEDHCKEHGGSLNVGWALWEIPTLFVEAEFHCVWRKPDGTFLDITPKSAETNRVLFLPDPSRPYEGRQVNNVRRSVRKDPLLTDYFETFNQQFSLMNRGARAGQHGHVTLEDAEAEELMQIMDRRQDLFMQLGPIFPVANPYFPCPCGSGKKTKWCHKQIADAV